MMNHHETPRRTILLGIDGATFDLLSPWMNEGLLPHLHTLIKEGVSGNLASTIPPTTPPAWASCITGKNPGKHSIFDFRESPFADPTRPLISAASVKGEKLWHLLNQQGKRVGVVNVPITYPPEKVDGFMISCLMTPSQDSPYTYPEELKGKVLKAIGDYVLNIDIPKYDVETKKDALTFLKDIRYSFEKRRDAFFYLMEHETWDFFMIVFIMHDRIQHLFWKYLDRESPLYHSPRATLLRGEIISSYQLLDEMLGALLKKLDDTTDLLVISDHGFGSTKKWFNVNRWLADLGLLKVKPLAQIKRRLFYQAMGVGEHPLVKTLIPELLQSTIRRKIRGSRSTFKADIDQAIDWTHTKAFFASIPCQGIYINSKKEGGEGTVALGKEYEELRNFIRERLLEVTDPATKENIVDKVLYREEVYQGAHTSLAPDILFIAKNYSYLGRQLLGAGEWIIGSENTPNGFHRDNGIFIAHGKHFKRGVNLEGASIMDIAPTILYSLGLPIVEDMDGKVLKEIFTEEFLSSHPIQYRAPSEAEKKTRGETYSAEERKKIEERLRALGYIE